jgi:hypothetical protein
MARKPLAPPPEPIQAPPEEAGDGGHEEQSPGAMEGATPNVREVCSRLPKNSLSLRLVAAFGGSSDPDARRRAIRKVLQRRLDELGAAESGDGENQSA